MHYLTQLQQQACIDACVAPLTRTKGGWAGQADRVYTFRTTNKCLRAGMMRFADTEHRVLQITPVGKRSYGPESQQASA